MFGVWSRDQLQSHQQNTRAPAGSGRGRRGGGGGRQWGETDSQHGGGVWVGDEGGVRGERGGFPEGGECGEGRRTAVKDLMPHQPNTVVTGIVITKQSVHSFPDKKNPGMDRFKFAFTMRDSPSDYVNVTCWGSETYIRSLVDSFKICDVVELKNPQILSKTGGESEERWRPWTSSAHQLNATEGHSTISLYSGWDYTDFTSLAHIPLRPLNDYYPLNDILSSGQTLEGAHVNLLAIIRHVYSPKQMTSKSGRPLKKCEVKLMDDGCSSFTFTIWDEELIDLAQTWTSKENIVFVVDARVSFNSYTNSMVASCDQKTIITTNPDCREAHQLYQYAQGLGDLNNDRVDEEREGAANSSFTDISAISRVYTIAEVVSRQASEKEPSFSGILYAVLMSINIDEDPARIVSQRCSTCKSRVQQGSTHCANTSCTASFATESLFSMPIALADHTGGLEGVRLSGKAATDLLKLTPEEFLENINPEQRTALKHSLQLERFKIYFKSTVLLTGEQRPLVRVLSMSPAQAEEVVATHSSLIQDTH